MNYQLVSEVKHDSTDCSATCLALSRDGALIARTGSDLLIQLNRCVDGKGLFNIKSPDRIKVMTWNRNDEGYELLCGLSTGWIAVVPVHRSEPTPGRPSKFHAHDGSISRISVGGSGNVIATMGSNGLFKIWKKTEESPGGWINDTFNVPSDLTKNPNETKFRAIEFVDGTTYLVVTKNQRVICFDVETGRVLWQIMHDNILHSAIAPGGKHLIVFTRDEENKQIAHVYEPPDAHRVAKRVLGRNFGISPIIMSVGSGATLSTAILHGSYGCNLLLTNMWTDQAQMALHIGDNVIQVAVCANARMLATSTAKSVKIFMQMAPVEKWVAGSQPQSSVRAQSEPAPNVFKSRVRFVDTWADKPAGNSSVVSNGGVHKRHDRIDDDGHPTPSESSAPRATQVMPYVPAQWWILVAVFVMGMTLADPAAARRNTRDVLSGPSQMINVLFSKVTAMILPVIQGAVCDQPNNPAPSSSESEAT